MCLLDGSKFREIKAHPKPELATSAGVCAAYATALLNNLNIPVNNAFVLKPACVVGRLLASVICDNQGSANAAEVDAIYIVQDAAYCAGKKIYIRQKIFFINNTLRLSIYY